MNQLNVLLIASQLLYKNMATLVLKCVHILIDTTLSHIVHQERMSPKISHINLTIVACPLIKFALLKMDNLM